jgi:hypothetical protein
MYFKLTSYTRKPFFFKVAFFFLFFSISQVLSSQDLSPAYYAHYTTKEVFQDGSVKLTKGEIFYRSVEKQLVYKNLIPSPQSIVIQDSLLRVYESNKLQNSFPYPNLLDFSIFHLILTSKLKDYGLHDTPFQIVETKKERGVVLTRWEVPHKTKSSLKAFEMAQKDGKLVGLISLGENDQVISKQIFSEYIYVDGLWVPQKSMEIKYNEEGGSHKKMMTFSKIKLNDPLQALFPF